MIHFVIAHVTILLIAAFFILFAASKADGLLALFGRILGAWVILVAVLHVVGCFAPGMMARTGFGPGAMHDHWMMQYWSPSPVTVPAPVQPAAPAPKKP